MNMTLPGLNPEANMLSYDFARFGGKGATDYNLDAPGAAMDCTRDFAQTGSAVSDVVASPGNIPKAGRHIVAIIQSLAVQ